MTELWSVKYGLDNIDDVETRIARRSPMAEQKFDALMKADPDQREKYFYNQCADHQEVWIVWDDDILPIYNGERGELINVWPDQEFAKKCHFPSVKNPKVTPIPLNDFMDKFLQKEPNVELSIFPIGPNSLTKVIQIESFAITLSNELARYQTIPNPKHF